MNRESGHTRRTGTTNRNEFSPAHIVDMSSMTGDKLFHDLLAIYNHNFFHLPVKGNRFSL
jgi:hypothetical protein